MSWDSSMMKQWQLWGDNPQESTPPKARNYEIGSLQWGAYNDEDAGESSDSGEANNQGRPQHSSNSGSGQTNPQSSPNSNFELFWMRAESFLSADMKRWNERMQEACSQVGCRDLTKEFWDDVGEPPVVTIKSPPGKDQPPGGGGDSFTSSFKHNFNDSLATNFTADAKASLTNNNRYRKQNGNGTEDIQVLPASRIQARSPPQDESRRKPSSTSKSSSKKNLPIEVLEVRKDESMERSISELTMRSSYAAAYASGTLNTTPSFRPVNDNKTRRMAYYAVGKHHRQAGRGGNRRCYFTGKLILGGAPFYAGSVQQGMRTLVVFCLPSALHLPDKDMLMKVTHEPCEPGRSPSMTNGTILSVKLRDGSRLSAKSAESAGSHKAFHMDTQRGILLKATTTYGSSRRSASTASKTTSRNSRLSSLDDLSLSIDGDLDPNWSLDSNVLLQVLPPASPTLLKSMADLYSEQFETLPVQVRQANVWKLYIKFCFFSGLPIAEGELHYKVRDEIAEQVYGEEIALSHAVMEASTGRSSAEILTLPNRAVLQYLRKQYSQQSSKLDDRVFQRVSWERVSPEV